MIECLLEHVLDKIVYIDNNATTKVAPEVAEIMVHYFLCEYGNSESLHSFGSNLQYMEKSARNRLAKLLNGDPNNFYFTSGATESNNWALKGIMKRSKKKHLITSQVEHPAIINVAKELERDGYNVTYLPVNKDGVVKLENLVDSIIDDTTLVSIMYANNETGVIMPIREIGDYLKDKKIVRKLSPAEATNYIETVGFCNPHMLVKDERKTGLRKQFFRELCAPLKIYIVNTTAPVLETHRAIREEILEM